MILTSSQFLERVNLATVAAMEILARDESEMSAVEYILLDQEIGDAVRAAYLQRVTVSAPAAHAHHYNDASDLA
jgi:hypothetical protein